jgi:multidrug efflux pump subunit AcrA (membrane-fusion protein)
MRKILIGLASLAFLIAILVYTIYLFLWINPTEIAAPAIETLPPPFRVYGVIEPRDKEILVTIPELRKIEKIYVNAGDIVRQGTPLLKVDTSLEEQKFALEKQRLQVQKHELALVEDTWHRTEKLFETQVISEEQYAQEKLRFELEKNKVLLAQAQVELAEAELQRLQILAPTDGKIYQIHAHLGEVFSPEKPAVIMGKEQLQVRLSIESFWVGKFDEKASYDVYHSQTRELLGQGTLQNLIPAMGPRALKTEDPEISLDTQFQEGYLLINTKKNPPIRLLVYVEKITEEETKTPSRHENL